MPGALWAVSQMVSGWLAMTCQRPWRWVLSTTRAIPFIQRQGQLTDGLEDGGKVFELIAACKLGYEAAAPLGLRGLACIAGRMPALHVEEETTFVAVAGAGAHMPMLVGEGDGCVALGGDALEDWLGFGLGLPYHDGDTGLDDAGLLAGYLLQRVAEKLRVVEAYIGDNGEERRDDVGAVQASTHTYFDDGDVDFFAGEVVEGEADGHFEEREVEVGEKMHVGFDEINDRLLRNHLAVDAYALAEIYEVRRGVEAHLVAGLLKNGGQEVGDGALAVGACHMDGAELALGVAKGLHHVDGGLYVGLIGSSADAVIHRQLREHEVQGFLIGHLWGMV